MLTELNLVVTRLLGGLVNLRWIVQAYAAMEMYIPFPNYVLVILLLRYSTDISYLFPECLLSHYNSTVGHAGLF